MAFNSKVVLEENIKAIKTAFLINNENRPATADEISTLRKYKGFGGLKAVLYDINAPKDKWSQSDLTLIPLLEELYAVLRENSKDEKEYKAYYSSIKESTLSAFYTPGVLTDYLMDELTDSRLNIKRILEPSAGSGQFLESLHKSQKNNCTVDAFEKDLITGTILKAAFSGDNISIAPFESIPASRKGKYDLVVSNIPFGNFAVFDSSISNSKNKNRAHSTRAIHSYFFTKAIDMASDNGIIAFIVTSSFLDNQANCPTRSYLMETCDLISAVRLPNNLFSDIANTSVGSDLIVLQKNSNKKGLKEKEKFFREHNEWNGININKLFIGKGTAPVIYTDAKRTTDQYGKYVFDIKHSGGAEGITEALKGIFKQDIANLKPITEKKIEKAPILDMGGLFSSVENNKPEIAPVQQEVEIPIQEYLQIGSLIKAGNHIYSVTEIDHSKEIIKAEYKSVEADNLSRLLAYIDLRDVYFQLFNYESEKQQENKTLREDLNKKYDEFVRSFGNLRTRSNSSIITLDSIGLHVLGLERSRHGEFEKADIFNKPVSIRTLKDEMSINEAYLSSLNEYGDFNKEFVLEKTQASWEDIRSELKGRIYYDPSIGAFTAVERVIGGNVYEKLSEVKSYLATDPNTEDIQELYDALEAAKPALITFDQLDFNLGERWLPYSLYSEFAEELFHLRSVSITFSQNEDAFSVESPHRSSYTSEEFCVEGTLRTYDGIKLLDHALNDTTPTISKKILVNGEGQNVPDYAKMQEANMKIERIQRTFEEWMKNRPENVKSHIEQIYNAKFNCFVKPKFNGSHLEFKDIDFNALGYPDLYQSQKDAVWMQLVNGGGIVDHEVGLGKTLTMCVAAYEAKRLGICNKPVITGLKANVKDIVTCFKTAYPHANILYIDKFDKKNRKDILLQIKNNDWDCIILTHENLAKIPCDIHVQEIMLARELDEIESIISSSYGLSRAELYRLEKKAQNIKTKQKDLAEKKKEYSDEGIPTFGEMGIDHIHVDESHIFKNLGFQTKHTRVAGLGNTEGSNRAKFLQYHITSIQERSGKDLGATFYSGTTISNSLTELYLIFKYLVPQKLIAQDIYSFDSWAAVYARKSKEPEFSVTNELIMKERFRYFLKVPELATFYNMICDYRTGSDINLDRPALKEELVDIEPTPDQKDHIEVLKEFAKTGKFSLLGKKEPTTKSDGRMLVATNESKKMAMDMRLINPFLEDHENNKISQCAERIYKHYIESQKYKGTQLVFCDMGTPNKDADFTIYGALKQKLVEEYNIPENEVSFIHDHETDKKKDKMKKMVNDGDIRILIGSTQKMGTGLNVQKRIIAMHHLDIPWKPSELEQRNGRGMRKGNYAAKDFCNNEVKTYIYAVKQTLDNYKFSLLKNKQTFITQIKLGQKGARRIDEGAMDENTGMNFAEYMAVLSGNTDLLDQAKIDKKIMILEKDYSDYNNKKRRLIQSESEISNNITKHSSAIEKISLDKPLAQPVLNLKLGEAKATDIPIDIPGFKFDESKLTEKGNTTLEAFNASYFSQLGKHIKATYVDNLALNEEKIIGSFSGFRILMVNEASQSESGMFIDEKNIKAYVVGPSGVRYTHNQSNYPVSDLSAGMYFFNAISKIPSLLNNHTREVQSNTHTLSEIKDIQTKEWHAIDELKELKAQSAELKKRIEASIRKEKQQSSEEPENKVEEVLENPQVVFARPLRPKLN